MADIFDQVAQPQAKSGGDVFDQAADELTRQQKATERRGEAEALLKRFEPVESPYDDPMAVLGSRAGHQLTRAALLGGGKKTDVAIGVLGPIAGAVAGGLTPIPGGAAAGGAGASGASDALVQAREYLRGERDDLSKGRLLASTVTGAFVPGGVKAAATPLATAVKTLAVRGGQGAGLGAAHEAISEAIDEGKLSAKGILTAATLGTLFGAGFGTLEAAAPHIIKALRGKTVAEAKQVIADELPRIDADAAMDAATKAELRGVLAGAQQRIDQALGVQPAAGATPTAESTAIGQQANAEAAFGGEAPLTRMQKADERAAGLRAGRAEDLKQTLLARQSGEGESTVLTGDEVQNQLTKLETRPGEARRERARLLSRTTQGTPGPDIDVNAELSAQAERMLQAEGHAPSTPPERRRATVLAEKVAEPLPLAPKTEAVAEAPKVEPVAEKPALTPKEKTHADYTRAALDEAGEGANFKYTVMRMGGDYPDAIQVDVFDKAGNNIGSSSIEELRALGRNVPDVPADVPTGQYTLEDIAKRAAPKTETPPSAAAPANAEKAVAPKSKNHIQELGGIKHPERLSENNRKPGEYDGFDGMVEAGGLPKALIRRDGGGSTPDQLVGELADRGVIVRDADDLFAQIEKARAVRPKKRTDVTQQNYIARFESALLGDEAKLERGGRVITTDDLRVGDTFNVNKEKFTVTGIDENGFVTVKDGITRTLDPNTPIFPDQGKVKRTGKKVPDFVPAEELAARADVDDEAAIEAAAAAQAKPAEPFSLASTTPDQQAAEAAANRERLLAQERKAKIDTLAEKPLTGDSSDVGQGTLLAGDEDLLSGPSAETLAKKTLSPSQLVDQRQRYWKGIKRGLLELDDGSDVRLIESSVKPDRFDVWHTKDGKRNLVSDPERPSSMQNAQEEAVNFALKQSRQSGKISTGLLFSTPLQSALGGITGAIYGSTKGETLDERRQNMLLYGAGGAALGAGVRIAGKALLAAGARKPVLEIDKHLTPPPSKPIAEKLADLTPPPSKPIAEKLADLPNNARAAALTIFAPLDKLDADVRKAASWLYTIPKRELPLSREFEQVAGATGKAGQDVRDYVRNVLDAVGEDDRQNFDRLVALKRIEQRLAWNDANKSDRKVVGDWTHAKVAADVAKLESLIGAKRVGELDAIAGGIMQREADEALQLQVASGRLSAEAYNRIKADNDFYAPFKVLDHVEGWDAGSNRAVDTRDQLAKVITGLHNEDFHIENPSIALAQHIFKGRILAEKNLKMLELAKLADNDVSGTLIRKLDAHDEPRRGYETVNYFDHGRPMRLEVKPEITNAIKGLNATETGMLANFAREAAGLFRFGATTGNLAFQPVNFALADQPNVWLVSKYGLKGAKDVFQAPRDFVDGLYASIFSNLLGGEGGVVERMSNSRVAQKLDSLGVLGDTRQRIADATKLARAFHESGASGSNWQELVDTMGKTVDEKTFMGSLKLGEHSLLDSIGAINKAIEESSKMMGFKRGLRIEGIDKMSPAQAEQALKKVVAEVRNFAGSPDFMRSGSAVRDLNNLAQMFLNARVQGVTNLTGRLAGADGLPAARDAWLRIGGTIGVGAAYLWYQNHRPENEADYEARSETEKRNYFLFPRTDAEGKPLYSTNEFGQQVREYWRLPKREVLQYMGNTVETALDFAKDKDPEAVKAFGVQMLENLSPVNISGRTDTERLESVIGGANPLVKVPYEYASKRDTFRHRDILPTDDLKRASPENQYVETTPKLLVQAAHALPDFAPEGLRSPMRLQNVVEGMSGRVLTQFFPKAQPEGRDPTATAVASNPLTARLAGSLYVDRSKEQADIDQIKQAEANVQVEGRRTARETINQLKRMSPDEATQLLSDLAAKEPDKLNAIIAETKRSERDVIDRQLLGLGVKNGARAKFIVGQLRKLDAEQAANYLLRLSQGAGAPLTDEVFQQVSALLSVEPPAPKAKEPASTAPKPVAAAAAPVAAPTPAAPDVPTYTIDQAQAARPGKFRGANGTSYEKLSNGKIIRQ